MMTDIFKRELRDVGDMMTVEEWREEVACGCITSYDGHGSFSNGTHETDYFYEVSVFAKEDKWPAGTTHIVWYNK